MPKDTSGTLFTVPLLKIEEFESRFEAAFNRENKKSTLFTPGFVKEVLDELRNEEAGPGIQGNSGKARIAFKSIQPNSPLTGVQTRGIKVKPRPEQIIEETMEGGESRREVKDRLIKECLKEVIKDGNLYSRPVPKKYSMVVFETEKKVHFFKSRDIKDICYLLTPEQELAFEKRIREKSAEGGELGIASGNSDAEQGMMIVGDEICKSSLF